MTHLMANRAWSLSLLASQTVEDPPLPRWRDGVYPGMCGTDVAGASVVSISKVYRMIRFPAEVIHRQLRVAGQESYADGCD
ncbi:hypothetical protein NtRootA1_16750 [Arthrobacter sp. NtRootA1]|nr:hypothetical protein NtRootA1_16750 [Arthrobacter sp. NtRootA1]